MKSHNIFDYPALSFNSPSEYFEDIFGNENFRIEKIYSTGQSTESGIWLSEDVNEFVILLEGEAKLLFENNFQIDLKKGDYFIIPRKTKHRVEKTAKDRITTWLTVHYK
ncbi:MAG: hypothetical protein A2X64_02405 [Ignavibacteria bacterium GWF2_33_9]|nr:MAG: hypothetical protein A2X64_02405 [Ignavibacteria bacterium GWF2_33_9]